VVLQATVRDRKGAFAAGLRAQHFELFEDGVKQSLRLFRHEDLPVTVGLVIDHSGSMGGKLSDVMRAARTFAVASSPMDEMFVINFNDALTLGLPASIRLANNPEDLVRAIGDTPASGQTALYDAINEGLRRLQDGTRDRKVLLVISDGGDNASVQTLPDILESAQSSKAIIYTVGIFDEEDSDRNPGVLKRLAHTTGGEAFFPARTGEVVAACERIAREIRSQYTLGYVSSNASQSAAFRKIRVTAHGDAKEKLSVRTRTGYFAKRAK
jgi:VWFA-related protein